MNNLPRPDSKFQPILKRPTTDNSAGNSDGKKDNSTKLDMYLSSAFLRDYFSKK